MTTAQAPAVRSEGASRLDDIRQYLVARKAALSPIMSKAASVDPGQLVGLLLSDIVKSPALLSCTPNSFYLACRQAAALGLTFGSGLGHLYLVPFKGTATLMVGYRGMVHVAIRCGAVRSMRARVVHEKDEFILQEGDEPRIHHVPHWQSDPGEALGAYCSWVYPDGGKDFVFMRADEILAIRDKSPAAKKSDSPWNAKERTVVEEMWKKTAIRRAFKALSIQTVQQAQELGAVGDADDRGSSGLAPLSGEDTIDTTATVSSESSISDQIANDLEDSLPPLPPDDSPEDEGARADIDAAIDDILSSASGKRLDAMRRAIAGTLDANNEKARAGLSLDTLSALLTTLEGMR